MATTKLVPPCFLAIVLGAGCGESSDVSPDGSTPTTDDIAIYQQLAVKVQERATTYRMAMMAPETETVADCQRMHEQYDAEVRPWVSRMVQMSGGMDRYMSDHGGSDVADHACVSGAMTHELDRHHAQACTLANLDADQEQAVRHVDAMLTYSGHMWDRSDQMVRGSDSGNWHWGPMMAGCEDLDGHCPGMGYDDDCGGGMMDGMAGGACCDS